MQGIKEAFYNMIQGHFGIDLKNRLQVIAEVEKFRWKEDESVWEQQKGKKAHEFEVYFDGEFICFFSATDHPTQTLITFLEKFKELYKEGRIFLDENQYKYQAAIKKAEQDAKKIEKAKKEKQLEKDIKEISQMEGGDLVVEAFDRVQKKEKHV